MRGLIAMLCDPHPLYDLFEVGDELTYGGKRGTVVACNSRSVALRLPGGDRVIERRDSGLEVAPYCFGAGA